MFVCLVLFDYFVLCVDKAAFLFLNECDWFCRHVCGTWYRYHVNNNNNSYIALYHKMSSQRCTISKSTEGQFVQKYRETI